MSEEIKKGLLGIVVDETEVSKVMPEINSLTYRGYAAQDLCEYCKFEEVAYLILNKDLPNSIELRKFEKEFAKFTGAKYAIGLSNATSALHLSLKSLGIGKGDEVLVPDITFVATANAVMLSLKKI